MENMFTSNFIPKFVGRDSMLKFFRKIGRVNASLMTKVVLEGSLKAAHREYYDGSIWNTRIGFATVLDVRTTVLKFVCPNLREITLHMSDKGDSLQCSNTLWDDDVQNEASMSNDQKVDYVVGKVVTNLKLMRVLKLGGHQTFEAETQENAGDFEDKWGTSVRWIKVVKERTKKRKAPGGEWSGEAGAKIDVVSEEFSLLQLGGSSRPLQKNGSSSRGGNGRGRGRGTERGHGRGRGGRGN